MSVRRPKTQSKKCTHCLRRMPRLKIERHPGIQEWQCSSFSECDEQIGVNHEYDRVLKFTAELEWL